MKKRLEENAPPPQKAVEEKRDDKWKVSAMTFCGFLKMLFDLWI